MSLIFILFFKMLFDFLKTPVSSVSVKKERRAK